MEPLVIDLANEEAKKAIIVRNIYILLGAFFWNTGWYFLRVLTVFDEPLGESNTERQVKISASISKEGI